MIGAALEGIQLDNSSRTSNRHVQQGCHHLPLPQSCSCPHGLHRRKWLSPCLTLFHLTLMFHQALCAMSFALEYVSKPCSSPNTTATPLVQATKLSPCITEMGSPLAFMPLILFLPSHSTLKSSLPIPDGWICLQYKPNYTVPLLKSLQ